MNRSTTLYIAIATLVLGSGTSFFAFVQPALTEQAKLKAQKAGLETQKASLQAQVKDLEGKATSAAMLDIAFFDLRVSLNQRRELETKTVQTLASLTEIFNDHKIRVQELTPTGETQGLNKPVPSAAPSGSPAPGATPAAPGTAPAAAAPGAAPAGAAGTPSPIQLTHKTFKLKVRGEYSDMVKALNEIQGLPRAISVNQYDLQLLDKAADTTKPAQPDQKGRVETVTALEMGFQVSITFLMAGGTPPQPAPAAPVGALPSADGLQAFVTWLLGGEARAAEQVGAVPHALPSVAAPQAATAKYRLNGVSIRNGAVHLQTSGGTPPYSLVGLTRNKAVLELSNTAIAPGAEREAAGAGAIRGLSVLSPKPGVVRVVVETDGSKRLKTTLDRYERLQLVTAPWNEAPRAADKRPAAVAARPAGALTRLQDVTFEDGELLVHTSGPAPRFESLGGTKTRLVIELTHAGIKAPGKLFPVQAGGIAQVRAVLYKNKPMITRLVVDTDGSVRLTPYQGADGRLRVRVAPFAAAQATGVKPRPIAEKPAKPAQAAIAPNSPAAKAAAPTATPTPMAKPAAKVAKAEKPAPRASNFPESDAPGTEGPHLQRSLNSSYAFPIERERTTGRANPFKVLPNRAKPKPVVDANGVPVPPAMPMGRPPVLPAPGAVGQAPVALPALPAAPAKAYALSAVVIGGAQPPVAAIKVDGKTHLVGLNETLPGNARVKSIKADHVVLSTGNQEIRIGLKK